MAADLNHAPSPAVRRFPRTPLVFFLLLMVLLHVRSFNVPHLEGDEAVYLALADAMEWDLSNYTTREHPAIRNYPYSIYRQELFHQPPLYMWVLKAGLQLGGSVGAGLAFQVLAMGILLFSARRAARLLRFPENLQSVLYASLVFGPLLLFSTTRLNTDGLLAIFLFCATTLYIEALDQRSIAKAILSGALFVLALNVRYNALAALPFIGLFQGFHLLRQAHLSESKQVAEVGDRTSNRALIEIVRDWRQWQCFAVVSVLILAIGLPHYYRIFATYGSVLPHSFIIPDPDVEKWNPFLERVHGRSRLHALLYLVAIFPMLLTWLSPNFLRFVRNQLRQRSWEAVYPLAGIFLLAVTMATTYRQLRYFAFMTPFMFTTFVLQIRASTGAARRRLWGWAIFTALLMFTSGFGSIILRNRAEIRPSLVALLPFLKPFYF
jgi:hypothetical protein